MSNDFPAQYAKAVFRYGRANHGDLAAMLNGIHEHGPEVSLPSLIFADWLEENDLPAHAEAVRGSVELGTRIYDPAGPYAALVGGATPTFFQPSEHDAEDGPDGHSRRVTSRHYSTGSASLLSFSVPHAASSLERGRRIRLTYPLHGTSPESVLALQREQIDGALHPLGEE